MNYNGFCPLGSGSKGNTIFLGTSRARILIDAGLSAAAIQSRLSEIQIDLKTIQAILITHEHIDHIRGVEILSKKFNIPIFANVETAKGICSALQIKPKFKMFTTQEPFIFEDLEIFPFSIPHDTLDPVAFTIRTGHWKLGVCTDLGIVPSLVCKHLEACDYLYIEANHEPSMVYACHRPEQYKLRVLGKQGHLSNQDCAALLTNVAHAGLKHVYLAHLSSECNSPDLALSIAKEALALCFCKAEVSLAYQDKRSVSINL